MDLLPLFHNLRDRRCVMVGGGEIALRKLRQLIAVGAVIEVIAPEINSSIHKLAQETGLTLVNRAFEDADLNGAALIVAATNDIAVNRRVSELAQTMNIPVNVVDNPELCSVIFPSIVDRSPVQIAISSAGNAPVLARMLRTRLESSIPAGYGKLAAIAGKYRSLVKRKISDGLSRKAFWEEVFEGDIAELV